MCGGVCGGSREGLAGVCVMRLEVGGGEDTRGGFVQDISYKFRPGLGGRDFWCYLGYFAGCGELRKR